MKGIVELPLEKGKQELQWYTGVSFVAGLNIVNPTVSLRTEKSQDFVAKRLWLVQWPAFTGVPANDRILNLPFRSTGNLRDGATKRALSLVAGDIRTILANTNPESAQRQYMGLACPYLLRGNTNLFVEVANPAAAVTPWTGDLYLVAEGYSIFPHTDEDIASRIKSYAVPFDLNGNLQVADPTAAAGNIAGQMVTITNSGEGRFIAKALEIEVIDNVGLNRTAEIMPNLALQITDTYSGERKWVSSSAAGQAYPAVPADIMTLCRTGLPFNMPRFIDPTGTVKVQLVFPQIAGALAYLNGLGGWPMTFSVTLKGALLPA